MIAYECLEVVREFSLGSQVGEYPCQLRHASPRRPRGFVARLFTVALFVTRLSLRGEAMFSASALVLQGVHLSLRLDAVPGRGALLHNRLCLPRTLVWLESARRVSTRLGLGAELVV